MIGRKFLRRSSVQTTQSIDVVVAGEQNRAHYRSHADASCRDDKTLSISRTGLEDEYQNLKNKSQDAVQASWAEVERLHGRVADGRSSIKELENELCNLQQQQQQQKELQLHHEQLEEHERLQRLEKVSKRSSLGSIVSQRSKNDRTEETIATSSTEDQQQLQNHRSNIDTSAGSLLSGHRSSSSPLHEQEQQLDHGVLESVSFPSRVYAADGNSISSRSTRKRRPYSYSNGSHNSKSEPATDNLKTENNIVHQSHYEQQQENTFTQKVMTSSRNVFNNSSASVSARSSSSSRGSKPPPLKRFSLTSSFFRNNNANGVSGSASLGGENIDNFLPRTSAERRRSTGHGCHPGEPTSDQSVHSFLTRHSNRLYLRLGSNGQESIADTNMSADNSNDYNNPAISDAENQKFYRSRHSDRSIADCNKSAAVSSSGAHAQRPIIEEEDEELAIKQEHQIHKLLDVYSKTIQEKDVSIKKLDNKTSEQREMIQRLSTELADLSSDLLSSSMDKEKKVLRDEENFSGIDIESSVLAPDATRINNDNSSYLSKSSSVRREDGEVSSRMKYTPLPHSAPNDPTKMTAFLEREIICLETEFREKKLRETDLSRELVALAETVRETENQHANEVANFHDKLELMDRERMDVERNFFKGKDTNEGEFQLIQQKLMDLMPDNNSDILDDLSNQYQRLLEKEEYILADNLASTAKEKDDIVIILRELSKQSERTRKSVETIERVSRMIKATEDVSVAEESNSDEYGNNSKRKQGSNGTSSAKPSPDLLEQFARRSNFTEKIIINMRKLLGVPKRLKESLRVLEIELVNRLESLKEGEESIGVFGDHGSTSTVENDLYHYYDAETRVMDRGRTLLTKGHSDLLKLDKKLSVLLSDLDGGGKSSNSSDNDVHQQQPQHTNKNSMTTDMDELQLDLTNRDVFLAGLRCQVAKQDAILQNLHLRTTSAEQTNFEENRIHKELMERFCTDIALLGSEMSIKNHILAELEHSLEELKSGKKDQIQKKARNKRILRAESFAHIQI